MKKLMIAAVSVIWIISQGCTSEITESQNQLSSDNAT